MTSSRQPYHRSTRLSRWITEHLEREDYVGIEDYIAKCNLDQLLAVMELCNTRVRDFGVLARLASKTTAEKLRILK